MTLRTPACHRPSGKTSPGAAALLVLVLVLLLALVKVLIVSPLPTQAQSVKTPGNPTDNLTARLVELNQQLETALAEEARLNAVGRQLQVYRRDTLVALVHLQHQPTTWHGNEVSPDDLRAQALTRFMQAHLGDSLTDTQAQLNALDAIRVEVNRLQTAVEQQRSALALEGISDPTVDSLTQNQRLTPADKGGGSTAYTLRGENPIPIAAFPGQRALDDGARPLIMPLKQPRLLYGFREDDPDDPVRRFQKGLRLGSLPGAVVYTPYDGKVVFAAPYRGFGNLLVIEHEGGGATLLAGLHSFAISVGDWVKQRTPVGVMDADPSGRHRLYFEFRVDRKPVDPMTLIGPIVDE